MLAIAFSIAAFDPSPISVMAMTAPTPMITPRAVSADRILFRRRLPKAVRSVGGSNEPANGLPPCQQSIGPRGKPALFRVFPCG